MIPCAGPRCELRGFLTGAQRGLHLQALATVAEDSLAMIRDELAAGRAAAGDQSRFAIGFGFHIDSTRELLVGLLAGAERGLDFQALAAIAEESLAMIRG